MDAFRRLLGTTQINLRQFAWALVPAIALLVLWELGKLAARRSASARSAGAQRATKAMARGVKPVTISHIHRNLPFGGNIE